MIHRGNWSSACSVEWPDYTTWYWGVCHQHIALLCRSELTQISYPSLWLYHHCLTVQGWGFVHARLRTKAILCPPLAPLVHREAATSPSWLMRCADGLFPPSHFAVSSGYTLGVPRRRDHILRTSKKWWLLCGSWHKIDCTRITLPIGYSCSYQHYTKFLQTYSVCNLFHSDLIDWFLLRSKKKQDHGMQDER